MPQAPSRIASASSHSRTVLSGIDLPVSRKWLAPAGASVKRNFRSVVASILRSTSSAGAITSGPMPSPPSTAMWRALLADMKISSRQPEAKIAVIASEAKQSIEPQRKYGLLRRFAPRNDGWKAKDLRRQYRTADQFALLQLEQRLVRLGERHRRHRDRRDFFGADEIEQFLRFA